MISGIIRDIFRLPIFHTMGKLTFGAYLIHPAVIRVGYGNMRQPGYGSDARIVSIPCVITNFCERKAYLFTISSYFQLEVLVSSYYISYLLSIILSLAIEIPFSVLQRHLFRRDINQGPTKTIYETTNPAEVRKLSKSLNELELKHKIPC